uniref:ATPTG10-like domain-containing protein n=1 Tax=Chromera velia CCMP2878 TaxID=1169474 RepID=A0A0G4IB67_9ALVE|mmetsp:Transcript_20932/g.41769  ORF Transcript_20932/g.41769 Transcript_20932/m.41769 type:complete len:126 (+) Transcript_20932:214-591(+)|eukprot:Cvel_2187.t1-p1 / transcript=Cvel_2187.t1 / gene=Cvel_2187 / organism=Chromera_velia_CCMP2878 / gene_product=hypothetical protein / transcript_product=hypothetical protein / location=Cvel_scaffold84:140998-142772(+) / protein_length=125 / sequence_SO=supercontig / SO=protein_coding / is_pseudo=false
MPFSEDQKQFLKTSVGSQRPAAVERLVGDLKMMCAYYSAAEWQEEATMHKAFNALSWDDSAVQKALPGYLASSGTQRARVDYAYNVLCPKPVNEKDPKQTMMHMWLKARLFSYDQQFPFEFNPYS